MPRNIKVRKGVLFIHIPKTGGTSINALLGVKPHNHRPFHNELVQTLAKRAAYIFTVVRNPYERARSLYYWFREMPRKPEKKRNPENVALSMMAQSLSLNDFWQLLDLAWIKGATRLFEPQVWFLKGNRADNKISKAIDVFRLEDLPERWPELCGRTYGALSGEMPWLNATSGDGGAKEELTLSTRQRLSALYAEDFEAFGYAP